MNASDKRHLKRLLHSKADIRASLQSFLAQHTKRSLKKPIQREREAAEKKERLSKKEETAAIRGACVERSRGFCEACGYSFREKDPAEMDHWLGGSGRRIQRQSIETCWMLHRACHLARQTNYPNAEQWNRLFEAHCKKYSYPFVPHIEHAEVSRG